MTATATATAPAAALAALNPRLAALGLPALSEAALATRPDLSLERLRHALDKAETGDGGARAYLARQLGGAAPDPATAPTARRQPEPSPAPPSPGRPALAPVPRAPTRPPASPPAAATAPISAPPTPAPASRPPDRVRCRIYGGKAALCAESDLTRQGEPTLRLEAAPATGPQTYDWARKRSLQLTREELPVAAAVALGLLPRCAFKNHGPHNDKGFEIEHQGTHLFVRLFQKDAGVLALPVGPADSYHLAALCLRQLRRGAPWLSDLGALALLKATVRPMLAAAQKGGATG